MANRPTAQFGSGGANGATPSPPAFIVPARRVRLNRTVANDNTPPLSRRLLRYALYTLIGAAIAFLALV